MAQKINYDQKVYDYAKEGDFDEVKELVQLGADINMVMMGASEGKHGQICYWALLNGACMLWGIKQEPQRNKVSVMKYNKSISMLKGPGEVARGTFSGGTQVPS